MRKLSLLAVCLAALMADGRRGDRERASRAGPGLGGASASALVTEAAKQLGVPRATLVQAIEKAAVTRIDEAVDDGDVDADDAADLKGGGAGQPPLRHGDQPHPHGGREPRDHDHEAQHRVSRRRKALIVARIDEAVKDGDLEADEAAELKQELANADVPGYKAGFGGLGFGFGGPHGRR